MTSKIKYLSQGINFRQIKNFFHYEKKNNKQSAWF